MRTKRNKKKQNEIKCKTQLNANGANLHGSSFSMRNSSRSMYSSLTSSYVSNLILLSQILCPNIVDCFPSISLLFIVFNDERIGALCILLLLQLFPPPCPPLFSLPFATLWGCCCCCCECCDNTAAWFIGVAVAQKFLRFSASVLILVPPKGGDTTGPPPPKELV